MLNWLFGGASEGSQIPQMLSLGNVGYLSASCCNPMAASTDEQLVHNLKEAMTEVGLEVPIHTETVTHAQAALGTAARDFDQRQQGVVAKVMSLFTTKGLSAFPILFVNGDIASYGGVPSKQEIVEHLRSRLKSPSKDKPAESEVGSR